jgi:predicted protein tyrosine phosphatase
MKKPIIQIASRRVAESIAQLARERGKAVGFLSIRSTDEDIPDLSTPGGCVLYLQFDDVDNENVAGCTPMDETQAQLIVNFIDEFCTTDVTNLVVTCSAGISRSAGVAAALHDALGWDVRNAYESNVFADGKFSPNMRCYRMVLRAMGCDVTPEELERLWQTAVDSADPV